MAINGANIVLKLLKKENQFFVPLSILFNFYIINQVGVN